MNQLELLERKSRLWNIEQAASAILKYTNGKSVADYPRDDIVRLACERQLIALSYSLRKDRIVNSTNVDHIITFGDQLVRNDSSADDAKTWRIIESDLPALLTEVRAVLATPDEPA